MGAYGIAGDPAGMRALASYLSAIADTLGSQASSLSGPVAGMTFEGPAATDFRARMQTWQKYAAAEVQELHDLAARLRAAAGAVEDQQAAERRKTAEEHAAP
jgi:uncharacterized protein YukE